jgi:Tol biopolymer transport system component
LAALAVIHFREVAPDLPSINAALLPPAGYTYFSDDGGHLALSPDGTMLAFVATDSSGKNGLWLRPLNTPSARQLSETEGASYPFWSPDNKFVGYFASGKLRKASIAGGPSVEICDAPNGRGGTWNRDGVILFAPNSDFIGIHRVSATGGKSVPVTAVDTSQNQSNHRWPKFLPDGKHFLYATQARVRTSDFLGAIYVSSLDSSVNKLLIKASSNVDYGGGAILYVRQKSVVAQPFNLSTLDIAGDPTPAAERIEFSGDKSHGSFSISENGVLTYQITGNNSKLLAMYDRSGKKTKEVGDRTVQYFARLSPDGTKVAFDSRDQSVGTADIWIYDVIRNISTRFTFDQSIEWSPIWSPTGDRIGYSSDRQGSGDLYVKSSNGTEAEQLLLKSVPQKQPSDWSPDGQTILFNDYDPTTRADLWVMPQEGKQEPFPFLRTEFVEENARFSPDGHWVVYRSDESGKGEIYVRPFPSGSGKWQVSVKGGDLPVWRRDGKEIFYQMGGAVMAVDVDGTGSAFTVGSAKQLFELPRSLLYDVSVDGTQVLMGVVSGEQGAPPVTLVTNWDKEMKRK